MGLQTALEVFIASLSTGIPSTTFHVEHAQILCDFAMLERLS
jgi:hypothetical protein